LRDLRLFEDVSARYGLEGRHIRGAVMLDPGHVGFRLDGEIAVADGRQVVRCGPVTVSTLAGGAGYGVGVGPEGVFVFDARTLAGRTYPLPGALQAAIAPDGRIYATTTRAVYALSPTGDLALLYDDGIDAIHGLAVSGDEVWFADGSELAVVEGDHVGRTHGANLARDATLAPSPTGDVWVITEGQARRVSRADVVDPGATSWPSALAPIFARSCAACHGPDGPSGIDLSTLQAWQSHRDAIRARVIVDRSMPPDRHVLSDPDRETIRAWARP
jgi:mono/diheme cytochrome c family protein